ncbi:C40 family peptidase [Jidongwangia harbinensis]|uniref:C40 family peptidase n=1 Tax=Jidongwangia harbinensis TaxID=2878561 RepID=UPI001CD98B64|nr:C40 family peptidase [Jidongwangia harbinensis]MCA2212395.1 C40 family peptidase [Jidongwangia harbinensis]
MHERSSSRRRRLGTGSIALSLGLCLCAGQLVGTPASAAPTTTAVQAAAAAAATPQINTKVSTKKLAYGKKVRIKITLRDRKTGKAVSKGVVRFQALRKNKWQTWTNKKVPASGNLSYDAKPLVSGYFRVYYVGTGNLKSVGSKKVYVSVVNSGTKIISEANKHVGALYKYGASGPKRFDCSGFTKYVYKKAAGRKLPHKANSQQKYGKKIAKSKKQVGDLIIIRSGSYGYHAGIYAGGNKFYDSPRSGKRVSKRKIFSSNYVVRRLV